MFPIRDENPSHKFPFFTVLLIAANVVLFFLEISGGEAFVEQMALFPIEVVRNRNLPSSMDFPPYFTVVTSMFLHGGWMHLIGNMWFLWIFGDNIEDFLGHFSYLFFYLITGVAAALTHVYLNPTSQIPVIGASGAVSGILGAYIVLHPRIRVKTLLTLGFYISIVRVPAYFFLGLWFLMQFLGSSGDRVAYSAHIGGFVAGVVIILLFTKRDSDAGRKQRYESQRHVRWH